MAHVTFAALLVFLQLSYPALVGAWHHLPRGHQAWQATGEPGIRGITVGPVESSQQPGRGYGTPYSAALLDEFVRMGVQWISITPFGRLWSLDSTQIRMDFEAPYHVNRRDIGRFVKQAHARGIRVLLIPHLWIETGGWRGEIDFPTEAEWSRYQASYRDFLMAWARDAAAWGVEALSIGVECKSWSGRFGAYWSELIEDVRAAFPGLLTYSANWDEVEDVLFWDQLDLIGINAFYPLATHNDATYDDYVEHAHRAVGRVGRFAETLQMPVLFVEVGYTTRKDAAVRPWLWPDHMTDVLVDEHEQARALAALLQAALPQPWLAGFFIWRYYANLDDVTQEAEWGFSPHAKLAERLVTEIFGYRWAVDPDPSPAAVSPAPPPWLHAGERPRTFFLP